MNTLDLNQHTGTAHLPPVESQPLTMGCLLLTHKKYIFFLRKLSYEIRDQFSQISLFFFSTEEWAENYIHTHHPVVPEDCYPFQPLTEPQPVSQNHSPPPVPVPIQQPYDHGMQGPYIHKSIKKEKYIRRSCCCYCVNTVLPCSSSHFCSVK